MPRQGAFRSQDMGSLARQLSFVKEAVARRQLQAIRALCSAIGPEDLVPWSRIVRAITQFPMESRSGASEPNLVGAPLVSDLRELSLRLSRRAPESSATALTLSALAKQWHVTLRTIHRFRKDGLQCCWISGGVRSTRPLKIGVRTSDAAAFAQANPTRIRAKARERLSEGGRRTILALAQKIATSGERRIAIASGEIARTSGVSRETIRRLLKSNPESTQGRLAGRRSVSTRDADRARVLWFRGEGSSAIAKRLGLSTSSADRLLRRVRSEAIRAAVPSMLGADAEIPPTFARADARGVFLAPKDVREGLDSLGVRRTQTQWLALGVDSPGATPEQSNAQILAVRFLLHGVVAAAPKLARAGGLTVSELDAIETDVRWAAALMRTLLRSVMPAIRRSMRLHAADAEATPTPARSSAVVASAVEALVDLVMSAPAEQLALRRVRVDRAIAHVVDRTRSAPRRRAGPVSPDGHPHWRGDPLLEGCPWMRLVEGHSRRIQRRSGTTVDHNLWVAKLGLDGTSPQTLHELAKESRVSERHVATRLARSTRSHAPAAGVIRRK